MVGMVVYQYILRIMASEGNKEAAETLILGVYRAIFWFVCFITLVAAVPYTYYRSKEGDDGDFDQVRRILFGSAGNKNVVSAATQNCSILILTHE